MATDRVYGENQWAGVKVTTVAKSQINSQGTDAYAPLVAMVGANGSSVAGSTNPLPISSPAAVPLGYQQITSLATAQALTVPVGATYAVIQTEAQSVRWRDDGVNPTASVGMILTTTGELAYNGTLATLRFIETAASAKLNISYYS